MATMDIIKLHGGEPANFLDLGGSVKTPQVPQLPTPLLLKATERKKELSSYTELPTTLPVELPVPSWFRNLVSSLIVPRFHVEIGFWRLARALTRVERG
eukprot:3936447-Rhodomonas_salina.2